MGDTEELLYPGTSHRFLFCFSSPFSLILTSPEGNGGGVVGVQEKKQNKVLDGELNHKLNRGT